MKKFMTLALAAAAIASVSLSAIKAQAADLVVGYFPEWPMPFQTEQAGTAFSDAGINVKWVSFDAGTAMSAAMASGDVHISISQGVTPFLTAASAGQDIQAIAVAVGYSDNNNCVVRKSLEITKDNAKELEGKTVGVPLSTAAHTDFLAQMAHFGVDTNKMTIVDMAPVDAAAAFASGNMDMVCGWGGPLRRMKEHGNPLLTGDEKESVSGKIFDVTSTTGSWAKENADTVAKFLKIYAALDAKWNSGEAAQKEMIPAIAKQAGMDEAATTETMAIFVFPSIAEQLSEAWMGGFVQKNFAEAGARLVAGGSVKALPDYSVLINTSYLEAASKM
ncbi:MAG: ABC transporter substrate-binding protein [Anderseniella sp.]